MMASTTTLHIGWPCHMRCAPQAIDGPVPVCALQGDPRSAGGIGLQTQPRIAGLPREGWASLSLTWSIAPPPVWQGNKRHDQIHGCAAPCRNIPPGWLFPSAAHGWSVFWVPDAHRKKVPANSSPLVLPTHPDFVPLLLPRPRAY